MSDYYHCAGCEYAFWFFSTRLTCKKCHKIYCTSCCIYDLCRLCAIYQLDPLDADHQVSLPLNTHPLGRKTLNILVAGNRCSGKSNLINSLVGDRVVGLNHGEYKIKPDSVTEFEWGSIPVYLYETADVVDGRQPTVWDIIIYCVDLEDARFSQGAQKALCWLLAAVPPEKRHNIIVVFTKYNAVLESADAAFVLQRMETRKSQIIGKSPDIMTFCHTGDSREKILQIIRRRCGAHANARIEIALRGALSVYTGEKMLRNRIKQLISFKIFPTEPSTETLGIFLGITPLITVPLPSEARARMFAVMRMNRDFDIDDVLGMYCI